MISYEVFKKMATDSLTAYLQDRFPELTVATPKIRKVNREADGFMACIKGSSTSPVVYFNDMYEQYLSGTPIGKILESTSELLEQGINQAPENVYDIKKENAKENIVFMLVNTEKNRELLSGVPHRQFQDLSVIYRWQMEMHDGISASTVVTDSLAYKLGVDEAELYRLAEENTRRMYPVKVISMSEMIKEIMPSGLPELEDEAEENVKVWVITNSEKTNGAASILYEDILYEISGKLGGDFYILPSSIHEVIAVPVSEAPEVEELAQMVKSVNETEVEERDRLSDSVYMYSMAERRVIQMSGREKTETLNENAIQLQTSVSRGR